MDVNMKVAEEDRRVPIRNMIYVADGPSDVPSFSVVNQGGGRTFGVYRARVRRALRGRRQPAGPGAGEQHRRGRLHRGQRGRPVGCSARCARIADEVCETRERTMSQYSGAPGHVV
jgi:hypothetical protein